MSAVWPAQLAQPAMRHDTAAPIGALRNLAPLHCTAILACRAWVSGDGGLAALLIAALGPGQGARASAHLGRLLAFLAAQARRPLGRRDGACALYAADEAALAALIEAAALGDLDAAFAHALGLVPPQAALQAALLAAPLGRDLLMLAAHSLRQNTAPIYHS